MTKDRQKEIEGSLFRMLGQNEASVQASQPNNMSATEDVESSDEEETITVIL